MKDQGEGLGEGSPQTSERRGVWVVGKAPACCAVLRKFGQASVESSSQGHLLKCTRDPPAAVPLPPARSRAGQQGRHGSCEP